MKEKIPPAFQWYPKDILSSPRVALMTLAEEGAYRRAIDYCWLQGSIPACDTALARLIGKGCSKKMTATIKIMFVPHPDEEGRLIHERLYAEREKQVKFKNKQVAKANKRWNSDETANMPRHDSGICRNDALHSAVCNLHVAKVHSLSPARGDLDMTNHYPHDFVVKATVDDEFFVEQSALALSTGGIKASTEDFKKHCAARLAEMKLTGESMRYPLGTVRKILIQDFKIEREKEKRWQRKGDNVHPPNPTFSMRKPLT